MRRVIEPVLSGDAGGADRASPDDVEYVRDLGLLAPSGARRIANPIYREVIPRELMYAEEDLIVHETEWYVKPDGDLDMDGLLGGFQEFFREHSEHWIERFQYKEAGPQLLLQAFLHRIVNAGGRIEREYALGRRRTDLLIVWPPGRFAGAAEPGTPARRHVIECKILRGGRWRRRFARAWRRRSITWTGAAPSRGTWWSSTGTGRSRGRRSSTGAGSRSTAGR